MDQKWYPNVPQAAPRGIPATAAWGRAEVRRVFLLSELSRQNTARPGPRSGQERQRGGRRRWGRRETCGADPERAAGSGRGGHEVLHDGPFSRHFFDFSLSF